MFYILLTALFIFIMIFIFRDDDEGNYNRKENGKPKNKSGHLPKRKTYQPAILPITYQEPPLSWGYLDSLKYDKDLLDEVMETEIVGLRYYCMPSDRGLVNGTVRPEPDNPHDPRAQVVIRADGKKLGYLPMKSHDEYEDFNYTNCICPFAGEITIDKKGYMHAEILVALPQSKFFVKERLATYAYDYTNYTE